MPFGDRALDLALANAVSESVGGDSDQRQFRLEHVRVAVDWMAPTLTPSEI
jgi:hypothetical protein